MQEEIHEVIVCQASEVAPGNSEASVLKLKDGRFLLAYTYFYGAEATVNSPARISAKISEDQGKTWGKRFSLQEQEGGINVTTPSLIRLKSGEIALFYLYRDRNQRVPYVKKSKDEGNSWEKPNPLTRDALIQDMANESVVELSTERILVPVCSRSLAGTRYSALCLYSDNRGKSWRQSKNSINLPKKGAMDPHVVELKGGKVLMTIRNQLGRVYQAISNDKGLTWTNVDSTDLQTPDSPITVKRIPQKGDLLMVWNNSRDTRRPLTSAISDDEGENWRNFKDLETEEVYSYSHPSITFIDENTLLVYNLYDEKKGWVSLKSKKLPIKWFYS